MGFYTLDESFAFSPFRRDRIFVKGFYTGTVASYDWTGSLYNQTTIAANTTETASPDRWTSSGTPVRGPNTNPYKLNLVPYVDTSGSSPTLKLASCGHTGDANDDFTEVDTGVQAVDDNNHLVCLTSTGIEFSDGNMVDGDHTIKWKHKHDDKIDTHYTVTAVLWASSNVLEARAHWSSSASASYVSTATAKSGGTVGNWKATWDPDANTWTVDTSDDDWGGSNNGNVSITTSDGTLSKNTTQYTINGSSPADGRLWEITVG